MDGPPGSILVTEDAIKASTLVIIPMRASGLDLACSQDAIQLCQDIGTPYLVVVNAKGPHDGKLVEEARSLLFSWKVPIADTVISHRAPVHQRHDDRKNRPGERQEGCGGNRRALGGSQSGRAEGCEGASGMNDEIDSFAAMFEGPPGEKQREARKAREKKERRTQLTEAQRNRGAGAPTKSIFAARPNSVSKRPALPRNSTARSRTSWRKRSRCLQPQRDKRTGAMIMRRAFLRRCRLGIIGCVAHGACGIGWLQQPGRPTDNRACNRPCRGSLVVGVAFHEGRLGIVGCLVIALLAGEAWALLLTAERTVAHRDSQQAPLATKPRSARRRRSW